MQQLSIHTTALEVAVSPSRKPELCVYEYVWVSVCAEKFTLGNISVKKTLVHYSQVQIDGNKSNQEKPFDCFVFAVYLLKTSKHDSLNIVHGDIAGWNTEMLTFRFFCIIFGVQTIQLHHLIAKWIYTI